MKCEKTRLYVCSNYGQQIGWQILHVDLDGDVLLWLRCFLDHIMLWKEVNRIKQQIIQAVGTGGRQVLAWRAVDVSLLQEARKTAKQRLLSYCCCHSRKHERIHKEKMCRYNWVYGAHGKLEHDTERRLELRKCLKFKWSMWKSQTLVLGIFLK